MQHSRKVHVLAALIAALALAGCGTSPAASESVPSAAAPSPSPVDSGGTSHSIPHSTNRPADPPLPDDDDQDTNNQLTADEASLGQLWALANSEVGTDASSSVIWPTGGLVDFAAAVTTRCYPIRTADEVAELEQLKATYEAAIGTEAAFEPAQAYFERATALCM